MATCTYYRNNETLAVGMPVMKNWLFNGGLERLLPQSNAPKLVGRVENNGIRFSKRQDVIDYFTNKPRKQRTLADIKQMVDTGKQPQEKVDLQYYYDIAVTAFTDSTRPFFRFIHNTFDVEQATKMTNAADRAAGMKAVYEKQAMDLFGRRIADSIKAIKKHANSDYKTAKDLAGFWMSAKYSIDANDWLMQKDQVAIDDLNAQIAKETDVDKLEKLNKALTKAQTEQAQRITAINNPTILDPTEQKTDAGVAGGYNKATAKDLMAYIEGEIPIDMLESAAKPVYEMNQWKLKQDIKDGKISQSTADKFPSYKHYVPLTGDTRTDDSVEDFFSTGSLNQAKDKQIGGRTHSLSQNGIDASFEQLEKSARYHGWKEFKDALEETYNKLIADKMATGSTEKEAQTAVWEDYDIKRRVENPMLPAGENDITVRKDGKGVIYTLNNQAAMEALRSANDETTPSVLKPFAAFTRFQARMVTQPMPFFAPTNALRDVAERSENIRTRKIVGHETLDMNAVARASLAHAAHLITRIKPVMMGVLAENTPFEKYFKVDNTDADVIALKRFLELGGSSTVGDYLGGDSKTLSDKLQKIGTVSDKAFEAIGIYNNSFELISSFSIYQALTGAGVSDTKAATEALNLMNFRKRGRIMSPLRSLFMFAQPTAHGGHQLAKTLGTKRGQLRFATYIIAAAFLYAMLRSGDDDDELGVNKMDEVGNFSLYRNIFIPLGGGEYIKVPVGFGMHQLAWSHGVNIVRTMLGEMTPSEAATESVALIARSGMSVASAETSLIKNPMIWLAQTFSPQIAKPIVNVALDVNSFGAPLTNSRYEKTDAAKSLQGRRDTPQFYKDIAQELGRIGFGDMYPEQLREFMRDYGAGAGNELLKWTVENPAKEGRGLNTVSPLVDRFVMATNDDSLKQRLYYRERDKINSLSVRKSTGAELTPEEEGLVRLGIQLKNLENRARGKFGAATRAENMGRKGASEMLRKQAERIRENYMDMAFRRLKD